MTQLEDPSLDQRRWNDIGKRKLEAIDEDPQRFIVDSSKFHKGAQDMIKILPGVAGKKILDFGSGRGEFSVSLAKLGGLVTGIDLGPDLVALSKRVASVNDVECDFVVGSVAELPFEDATFDYVVGNGVLHHLPPRLLVDSLREASRVLKPGGMAFFNEPIENSKAFEFVQNVIPVERPGMPEHRPSILQRAQWKKYLAAADDRPLSNKELLEGKGDFRSVTFEYYGLLIRLSRLVPNPSFAKILRRIDLALVHPRSPVKHLAQSVLVRYEK